ncbi:MAG: glycerol-3-phosphate 1-O-acyltransferase [Deltaproteobacteria bacterium]|nr:glycerol-3-phosphate 1-O-acyltransferase [Deltaproteobacteria bacterium]
MHAASGSSPHGPQWPESHNHRIVFLLDAASLLEERALRDWIAAARPADFAAANLEVLTIPSSRGKKARRALDPRLEVALASDDNPLFAPLRIAWQPAQRDGVHAARLSDLLTLGDPRDPGPLRQRWIRQRHPDRCCIVAGEPATAVDLRQRWRRAAGTDTGHTVGLPEFVARQAALALERAERRLRGTRYKVPRFVHEEILTRPAFRSGVAAVARELGRDEAAVTNDAARYLHEIAATHSTYVIDLVANLIRALYQQGYGGLHYDRADLERIYALAQRHPVVFLPSHKSNLDHLVLQSALHENGHPPNHTAGGINMNFFPVGPLVRRSGVFFIRRTFKDNATYKFVLRQYVDYLMEKRFPLEWYIEGGRSRGGKLLPPRFGLLAYVVDSYRRGKSEDVHLIPVSIAYDQIQDVSDYVAEQRGGKKEKESFGWFLRLVRRLRRRYGNIHIRFGEPLSLADALGPPDPAAEPNPDEQNLTLQKLAFEVSVRINRATPITPTSLVTMALLGVVDRALTVEETRSALANLVDYVRSRRLPTTGELDLEETDGVQRALDALVDSGVIACFDEGPDAVYMIGADQHLTAAYYRNTIIHFFVNGAIAEIALLAAADRIQGATDEERLSPVDCFWEEAFDLRDLFKFEFFFADKETFRREIREELRQQAPDWENAVKGGADSIRSLVRRIRPFSAHRVLRPFAESYRVVADALLQLPGGTIEDSAFQSKCLALGKQYQLQRRIRNPESVSKVLFETAVKLARNRGLLDEDATNLGDQRRAFAEELREAVRRIDAIGTLAASRFAGLIP